jgi:hypothetical protein
MRERVDSDTCKCLKAKVFHHLDLSGPGCSERLEGRRNLRFTRAKQGLFTFINTRSFLRKFYISAKPSRTLLLSHQQIINSRTWLIGAAYSNTLQFAYKLPNSRTAGKSNGMLLGLAHLELGLVCPYIGCPRREFETSQEREALPFEPWPRFAEEWLLL